MPAMVNKIVRAHISIAASINPSCRISKVVKHPRLSITSSSCSGLAVIANKFSPSMHADLGVPNQIQTNDVDVVVVVVVVDYDIGTVSKRKMIIAM